MIDKFIDNLYEAPIIAAIRDLDELDYAIENDCQIIFLMDGTINNIKEPIKKITQAEKMVLIYLDMVKGITKDRHGIEYLAKHFQVDGIITNKHHLIKTIQDHKLIAGLHIFLIDSISLDNSLALINDTSADFIELMPETTGKFIQNTKIPVIASGMIDSFDLAKANLGAGAVGVSTSKSYLWKY